MILEEYKDIKIANKNLQYYLSKGYEAKIGNIISVKNEDIPDRSRILEKRICDEDGEIYTRPHCAWVETYKSFQMDLCPDCAKKKRHEKMKQTNLKKYGVEYPMQSKEVKLKAIESTIEHYGCEYSFQNEKIQSKAKQSIIDKFGVDTPTKNPEVIEKMKQTNLTRYGCENVFQNEDVKEKSKQTILDTYGCEYITQSKEVQEKIKQTFIEKYGVEHPLQLEEFNNKAKQTTYDRYGVIYAMQSSDVKQRAINTLCKNGSIPTSKQQLGILQMVQELYPEAKTELNKQCSECSLDVELVLPSNIKIDIEYDGQYWHQDSQKDRRRDEIIKTFGYKILRIKSSKKLPLLQQLQEGIEFLANNDVTYSHIILDDWKE